MPRFWTILLLVPTAMSLASFSPPLFGAIAVLALAGLSLQFCVVASFVWMGSRPAAVSLMVSSFSFVPGVWPLVRCASLRGLVMSGFGSGCVSGWPCFASLLLLGLVVSVSGCGEPALPTRGVRVGGSGMVTLDGELLQQGRIVMIMDQGNGEVKAAAMIRDGAFEFTEESGPLEGKARVEIYPVGVELEEFESQRGGDFTRPVDFTRVEIPVKYNVKSELIAEVSAEEGIFPLTFELTGK